MARYKRKVRFRNVISAILAIALIVGACAGITAILRNQTKKISPLVFSRGAIDEQGQYVKSETSICNEELIDCQGLTVVPGFKSNGTYRIFYYSANESYIGSTEEMKVTDGTYTKGESFIFARYCRIMITPDAVDEDGKADKDFKIKFYEALKYASLFTIKVNKVQHSEPEEMVEVLTNHYKNLGAGTYNPTFGAPFTESETASTYFFEPIALEGSSVVYVKMPISSIDVKINGYSVPHLYFGVLEENGKFNSSISTNVSSIIEQSDDCYIVEYDVPSGCSHVFGYVDKDSVDKVGIYLN